MPYSRPALMALALAIATPVLAEAPATLSPVIVTASGIPVTDADATYASEVHDRVAIERSGAISLSEYLAKHTSLNVMPNGNNNAPLLDMRGYGLESGAQNMVIVVDGYRLNSMDQANVFLGATPIEAVEQIEINKGSGSILFGDGAMSGVIQIRTRTRNGLSMAAMQGTRGTRSLSAGGGVTTALLDLSVYSSDAEQGYQNRRDVTGHHDGSHNRNTRVDLVVKPVSDLRLILGAVSSDIDSRYSPSLTAAQFHADPRQNGGKTYNHHRIDSDQWKVGFEYQIDTSMRVRYLHNAESRRSEFIAPFASRYDYDAASDELSVQYRTTGLDLTAGMQSVRGDRFTPAAFTPANTTSKDNAALYLQAVTRHGPLSLSAGARREVVEYTYAEAAAAAISDKHKLNAWDVGANYRFSDQWSGFATLNQAFQAPDVDRFFMYDFLNNTYVFNRLIKPAVARTLTLGANLDAARHRLRVAVFHARLRDEIYFDPVGFSNANLDGSRKTGIEVQERWQAREDLALSLLYTYTRSRVDEADIGGTLVRNKELPGVPRHGVTLGADYIPWANGRLNVTHTWRDSAYAISNFSNSGAYRQSVYNSTSVSLRHQWGKVEAFAGIDNLFDQKNGLSVYSAFAPGNLGIYPVNLGRSVRAGIKLSLF